MPDKTSPPEPREPAAREAEKWLLEYPQAIAIRNEWGPDICFYSHEQTIELLEAYSAELRANMDELQMRESLAKRGWAIEMEKSRAAEARAKEMETAMRQIYGIAKAMAMGQCRAAKSIITADMNAIADLSETFLASTAPEGGAAK